MSLKFKSREGEKGPRYGGRPGCAKLRRLSRRVAVMSVERRRRIGGAAGIDDLT